MGKAPAFQLYAADFYMDTVGWTATEVGVYFRLLMHEWVSGPLPKDNASLSRIGGVDHRNMQKMWSVVLAKKFTVDAAGMYVNERLEEVRATQDKYREQQAEKGKISAEKRATTPATTVEPEHQPEGNSSSSSSSSSLNQLDSEPFRLPSKEEIENSSKPLILKNIDKAANELYEKKIWLKVHIYKNAMLKHRCNERAILKSLMQCLIKKPENPWAYCAAIMKKEDGNFNARDYEKNHG